MAEVSPVNTRSREKNSVSPSLRPSSISRSDASVPSMLAVTGPKSLPAMVSDGPAAAEGQQEAMGQVGRLDGDNGFVQRGQALKQTRMASSHLPH